MTWWSLSGLDSQEDRFFIRSVKCLVNVVSGVVEMNNVGMMVVKYGLIIVDIFR